MSAAGTPIMVSAERSGTAAFDGQQHLQMMPADPAVTALKEWLPRSANDVGHLQREADSLKALAVSRVSLFRGQDQ